MGRKHYQWVWLPRLLNDRNGAPFATLVRASLLATASLLSPPLAAAEPVAPDEVALSTVVPFGAFGARQPTEQLRTAAVCIYARWRAATAAAAGDWHEAVTWRQRALDSTVDLCGPKDWRVSDANAALVHAQRVAQLSPRRRQAFQQAQALDREAAVHRETHRYAQAAMAAEQSLALHKALRVEPEPIYARRLSELALLYHAMGRYRDAQARQEEALAIRGRALGQTHPDYAQSLDRLAVTCTVLADHDRAERLQLEAMTIRAQTLGTTHLDYAASLQHLAATYRETDRCTLAEERQRDALEVLGAVLGEADAAYARGLNELGLVLQMQGRDRDAERYHRRALAILAKARPRSHPDYVPVLQNLARAILTEARTQKRADRAKPDQRRAERLEEAEQLARRALALTAVPGDTPDHARSLDLLATVYRRTDRSSEAERAHAQAQAIRKQALFADHPSVAAALTDAAIEHESAEQFDQAHQAYQEALAIYSRALEKHPAFAECLSHFSRFCLVRGQAEEAATKSAAAVEAVRQTLDVASAVLSERQQLEMAAQELWHLDVYLSCPRPASDAYAEYLHWKGAVTARQMLMRRFREELATEEPEVSHIFNELQDATRKLAQLTIDPFPVPAAEVRERRLEIRRVNRQVEELERRLYELSARFRRHFGVATPKQIQAALPPDAVLIDLFSYDDVSASPAVPDSLPPFNLGMGLTGWLGQRLRQLAHAEGPHTRRRLGAFVVRHEGEIIRVDLGPAAPIEAAVHDWRLTLGAGRLGWQAGQQLRELVWLPLEREFKAVAGDAPDLPGQRADVTHVIVSPVEALARLPWGALPGVSQREERAKPSPEKGGSAAAADGYPVLNEPKRYLIEDYTFTTIVVSQLMPALLAQAGPAEAHQPSMLAMGRVDYGNAADNPPARPVAAAGPAPAGSLAQGEALALAAVAQAERSPPGGPGQSHWDPLKYTKTEVDNIASMFRRRFQVPVCEPIIHDKATEAEFRRLAPQCRYLHLATHGYFDESLNSSASGAAAPRAAGGGGASPLAAAQDYHPGVLSGVVLAGANLPPNPPRDDGILTALEVEELNLSRVELVVLSACETGLGHCAGGEGLLGLQRAFQIAGARSVVASLWKVPDVGTERLMQRFYECMWEPEDGEEELSKAQALRRAQLEMLVESRTERAKRGISLANHEHPKREETLPYTWAAFVLSGDWR